MKRSHFFMPLLKETPAEAQVISHQLMLRSGMICQEAAGIYSWLPLGLRVLNKVSAIIRREQARIYSDEILMPTLQPADLWRESGRYDAYGKEMLRIQDRHGRDMLYGPTNEEMVTFIFKRYIKSYRQLPVRLYHIQWKFRDEIRPRFGVMRGREFLMKDAYSFDLDETSARTTYFEMMEAYMRTFKAMGLTVMPVQAATGAIGGDLSHEFHILTETGESAIYYDPAFDHLPADASADDYLKLYAKSDELHDPTTCPIPADKLAVKRGIEVGHIFYFGQKYTQSMDVFVIGEEGQKIYPEMGSYGIGVGRVVAGIIEANHDAQGIKWPLAVAPFTVGIINLKAQDTDCSQVADNIYEPLQKRGIDVLYDDCDASAGEKFAAMDLIGIPFHVIIGPKGLKDGVVEVKSRLTGERTLLSPEACLAFLSESLASKS